MQLKFSHAVLNVRDLAVMVEFYVDRLGFVETDRGPLGPGAPDIVFLSQDAQEHHQLALAVLRKDDASASALNHLAFRVDQFADLKTTHDRVIDVAGVKVAPITHGNALSVYFNDPEGNGLELFWDTPWHVRQPVVQPWDITLDEQSALDWVEAQYAEAEGFEPLADYYAGRHQALLNAPDSAD